MVKVYSINECPWCEKVKKYLKSKHVDFEEHNIEVNEADRDACYQLTGDMMGPMIKRMFWALIKRKSMPC